MFLRKLCPVFFILCFAFFTGRVFAAEVTNGNLRLILNERTGSFSLYFLSDHESMRYEPLFNSRHSSASYSSISVNGTVYRLGDRNFRSRYERHNGNPSFVFEFENPGSGASGIIVRQTFSAFKTPNSSIINGVMITFDIQNTGDQSAMVGLRMILDTELGEEHGRIPFITSTRILSSELLIDRNSDERFWISRGQNVSLMGSIINPLNPSAKAPDYVHFANWNILNRARWQSRYSARRSFNNDSAVCYIYTPEELAEGSSFSYSIFLTTEDVAWYNSIIIEAPDSSRDIIVSAANASQTRTEPAVIYPQKALEPATISIIAIEEEARMAAQGSNENPERLVLIRLNELIEGFLSGDLYLNEQDMIEIENFVNRHR